MIIITGVAGFIGFHLCKKLLEQGEQIIGIDSINNYYDVNLKRARLDILETSPNFTFYKADISKPNDISQIFKKYSSAKTLIHLAAQAGVRYSLENPFAYVESNVTGQVAIFEAAKNNLNNLEHIIYASSSSVYGNNEKTPFAVTDRTDDPISLYAATKKSGELIANYYSNTFKIPTTGLRFFTVYGPYGRPDMAYFSFTKNILEGKSIKLFNNGDLKRDFTFVDDIISGVIACISKKPQLHKIYNLGNNKPVELKYFVTTLEKLLGKKAVTENLPMQTGDVYQTFADIDETSKDLGFKPTTSIETGLEKFVKWYREYYKV
jgi:UDP-glucuronate 4-epimerase